MVLGHFGPKKPTHTYPNKTTAYPYSYPNPTTTSLPNSTLEAQFGVSMSRFGFERKSKSRNHFFFFPTSQALPCRSTVYKLTCSIQKNDNRQCIFSFLECMCSWSLSHQKFPQIEHLLLCRHLEHSIFEREKLIFVHIGFFFA